jgi:hypothetical protein
VHPYLEKVEKLFLEGRKYIHPTTKRPYGSVITKAPGTFQNMTWSCTSASMWIHTHILLSGQDL